MHMYPALSMGLVMTHLSTFFFAFSMSCAVSAEMFQDSLLAGFRSAGSTEDFSEKKSYLYLQRDGIYGMWECMRD